MATYYGTSEIQSDGLQTLYLMNPGYVGYSDPQTANMVFLNSAGNPLNPTNLPHPSQQNQHFVGIPLPAQDHNRPSVHNQTEISGAAHGFMPHLWTPIDPAGGGAAAAAAANHHQIAATSAGGGSVAEMTSLFGLRRSVGQRPATASQQGLSLSLSPQQPAYGAYRTESDIPARAPAPAISPASGDDIRISGSSSSASAVSNGISGLQSVLMGSKYLKAAQQLLDEVVSVGKDIKTDSNKGNKGQLKANRDSPGAEASGGGESNGKRSAELTTAERQELQMKKAKLIGMLDEVEQRYRQYHHQMQIVVSSFEAAAGIGSAKTYTALALQTISKQFRCLRDAITGQIRATSRSLGEEDCLGGKGEGSSSRLRFVDQHLRQQRALQQLGMMQNNAWRPQRGLPERSVSVLRAWLFEHFLHPYPKDSDKHMLAKQTGLTRSQVSNWFINARVRLWKPMVEEMYLEETKIEQDQNGSEDKTSKSEINEDLASKSAATQENSATGTEKMKSNKGKADNISDPKAPLSAISNSPSAISATMASARSQACFSLIGSSPDVHAQATYHDNEGMMQRNSKKGRIALDNSTSIVSMGADLKSDEANEKELYMMKFGDERPNRDGYSLIAGNPGQGGGFGGYSIGEIGRFDPEQFTPRFSGNGVSLTLGLPHCENLSLSGAQQTYLSNQNITLGRRLEMANETNDFCNINTTSAAHSANAYESMNIQNRKRFVAQLLPDFVA